MAERTKGTIIKVETARASGKTISGLTNASPGVVTATAHGYSNGDIAIIQDVGGLVEVNDRAFVIASSATDTFALKGEDTSNFGVYTSGGSAKKVTLTEIGEVLSYQASGSGSSIDVTNLRSISMESLAGLVDPGKLTMSITIKHGDAGQAAMRALVDATEPKVIEIVTPSGYVLLATGNTSNFDVSGEVNSALKGSFEFTIRKRMAWFA